ncbi:hypothetical protein D3C87_2194840 [compost metagenome]
MAAILKLAMPTGMPIIVTHCTIPAAICDRQSHQPNRISQTIFSSEPLAESSALLFSG